MKQEVPTFLYVMETKIRSKRVEQLQNTLRFGGCFVVNSVEALVSSGHEMLQLR